MMDIAQRMRRLRGPIRTLPGKEIGGREGRTRRNWRGARRFQNESIPPWGKLSSISPQTEERYRRYKRNSEHQSPPRCPKRTRRTPGASPPNPTYTQSREPPFSSTSNQKAATCRARRHADWGRGVAGYRILFRVRGAFGEAKLYWLLEQNQFSLGRKSCGAVKVRYDSEGTILRRPIPTLHVLSLEVGRREMPILRPLRTSGAFANRGLGISGKKAGFFAKNSASRDP